MKQTDFDLRDATVAWWSLDAPEDVHLLPWSEIIFHLTEDLIYLTFPGDIAVDVGWYEDPDGGTDAPGPARGRFRTVVILDDDWESPAWSGRCRTMAELRDVFQRALGEARRLMDARR